MSFWMLHDCCCAHYWCCNLRAAFVRPEEDVTGATSSGLLDDSNSDLSEGHGLRPPSQIRLGRQSSAVKSPEGAKHPDNTKLQLRLDETRRISQKLHLIEDDLKDPTLACFLDEEDICPTCLDGYDSENPKINTECKHHFHLACILEWAERRDTCPVCDKKMVF